MPHRTNWTCEWILCSRRWWLRVWLRCRASNMFRFWWLQICQIEERINQEFSIVHPLYSITTNSVVCEPNIFQINMYLTVSLPHHVETVQWGSCDQWGLISDGRGSGEWSCQWPPPPPPLCTSSHLLILLSSSPWSSLRSYPSPSSPCASPPCWSAWHWTPGHPDTGGSDHEQSEMM